MTKEITITITPTPENKATLYRLVKCDDAFGILHDLAQKLRKKLKYEEMDEPTRLAWNEIHTIFWDHCREARIDPMED